MSPLAVAAKTDAVLLAVRLVAATSQQEWRVTVLFARGQDGISRTGDTFDSQLAVRTMSKFRCFVVSCGCSADFRSGCQLQPRYCSVRYDSTSYSFQTDKPGVSPMRQTSLIGVFYLAVSRMNAAVPRRCLGSICPVSYQVDVCCNVMSASNGKV